MTMPAEMTVAPSAEKNETVNKKSTACIIDSFIHIVFIQKHIRFSIDLQPDFTV
jgi:hypothetical protein